MRWIPVVGPFLSFASKILIFQGIVATLIAAFAVKRRPSDATPAFALTSLCVAWWSLSEGLQLSAVSAEDRRAWWMASYVGICLLPPAFLGFALRLTGRGQMLHGWRPAVLFVPPIATLIALFTNDSHHMFGAGAVGTFGSNQEQLWRAGPAFWAHTAYSYAALGTSLVILGQAVFTQAGVLSRQMLLLLAAGAVPLIANIFRVASIGTAAESLDPTPFAFFVSIVLVPFALGRERLLDVMPADRAAAFLNSPEALLVLDDRDRITAASNHATSMLGVRRDEMVGRPLLDFLPVDTAPPGRDRHATRPIDISIGEETKVIGFKISGSDASNIGRERVVSLRDDTHRALELKASQVSYQDLFDEHPLAIMVHDPQTLRVVSANRAAQRDYRSGPQGLMGVSLDELWADESLPSLARYVATLGDLSPFAGTAHHRRCDGEVFPVELRRRRTSFAGAPAVILSVEDTSSRKEAERRTARLHAEVATSAALWRSTVDALDSPLLVLDGKDRVESLNEAAAKALGLPLDSALGTSFEQFCGRQLCQLALETAREARGLGSSVERHLTSGDDSLSSVVKAHPVAGPEASATSRVVVMLVDATRMIKLERKLTSEAAFARLGAIVAGVAHDVRGPLAGLTVNLDAFQAEAGNGPEIQEAFEPIHRSVRRINDLMQSLLDYGRPLDERRRRLDLRDVVQRAVIARGSELGTALTRIDICGPGGVQVLMDEERVRQAIGNLIENALQHSPPGTVVTVEVEQIQVAGKSVARVSVRDRGPGFPLEDMSRVFEPFYSRRRGGTGLGLAIVGRIAELHGGRAWAGNREGGGAVVAMEMAI